MPAKQPRAVLVGGRRNPVAALPDDGLQLHVRELPPPGVVGNLRQDLDHGRSLRGQLAIALQFLGERRAKVVPGDPMRRSAESAISFAQRGAVSIKVIGTDDTCVKVLNVKLPLAGTERIWLLYGDKDHPVIVYDYTPTREPAGAEKFLKGYCGLLTSRCLWRV